MVLNEEKIKLWSRYDKEDGPHSLYGLPRPHHHSRPHDWAAQYSDEESEETHIDTVRDDEDVDEDEDEDEDEVIEIKTPSRRSSSSSLNDAADAALRPSTDIHISEEFVQEQLGQKPPVHAPHDETEGESSESGTGTGSGSSSAAPGRSRYRRLSTSGKNVPHLRNGKSGSGSGSGSSSGARRQRISRSNSSQDHPRGASVREREHVTIAPIAPTILKAGEENDDDELGFGMLGRGLGGLGGPVPRCWHGRRKWGGGAFVWWRWKWWQWWVWRDVWL